MKGRSQEEHDRHALRDELYRRYSSSRAAGAHSFRYRSKIIVWVIVVRGAQILKRILDIIFSAAGLIALAPLFASVALLIKLTDRGPVLYWQTRVGLHGREFLMPKFRSMVVNAEKVQVGLQGDQPESVRFKMKRDPRITWIGRFIRKFSIDELPQLWNVLKGQMSLVGPRPPIPKEVREYTVSQRRRLDVIPGLTCIWQVSGRSDIPFEDQVHLDVMYIESQDFFLDLKLLLKTIPAVLLGKGAY